MEGGGGEEGGCTARALRYVCGALCGMTAGVGRVGRAASSAVSRNGERCGSGPGRWGRQGCAVRAVPRIRLIRSRCAVPSPPDRRAVGFTRPEKATGVTCGICNANKSPWELGQNKSAFIEWERFNGFETSARFVILFYFFFICINHHDVAGESFTHYYYYYYCCCCCCCLTSETRRCEVLTGKTDYKINIC